MQVYGELEIIDEEFVMLYYSASSFYIKKVSVLRLFPTIWTYLNDFSVKEKKKVLVLRTISHCHKRSFI